jgi:CBS domain-containing protein
MTPDVVVGSADITIRDAAKLMRDHVISCRHRE